MKNKVAVDERTLEQLLIALAHLTARAAKVAADIENEQQRVGQWKIENIRRRHNYVPFILNFLKARPRDAAERRPRRGGGRVP